VTQLAASTDLTEKLRRYSAGDREMAEAVLAEVLPRLHQIAVRELRRERYMAPLEPTELINEVWIRNLSKGGWQIEGREHFYAIAARAMRWVLVDFARSRLAQRRGDGRAPTSLEDMPLTAEASSDDLEGTIRIGELMEKLEKFDHQAARIVDMHYFAGFTLDEIAKITGLTVRHIRHRWEKGRDWLKLRL
jgi:RNA polymerase sigma factor (TIGR02999 family)